MESAVQKISEEASNNQSKPDAKLEQKDEIIESANKKIKNEESHEETVDEDEKLDAEKKTDIEAIAETVLEVNTDTFVENSTHISKDATKKQVAESLPKMKIFGSAYENISFGSVAASSTSFLTATAAPVAVLEGKPEESTPAEAFQEAVKQVSGEEEEICVFSCKAKLFVSSAGQWKERGKGLLKINCAKGSESGARLLLRHEVLKNVLLNCLISEDCKFTIFNEKFLRFSAYSQSEKTFINYLLKTASPEDACTLLERIGENK